jgi:uncharacterized membrane protein
LREDLPVLLAYVLSFVYIGIYWNNNHRRHLGAPPSQHRLPREDAGQRGAP